MSKSANLQARRRKEEKNDKFNLMKTSTLQKKLPMALAFVTPLLFGLLSLAAAPPEAHALPAAPQSEMDTEDLFEYRIEGRPDPFAPFISPKAAVATIDEVVPIEEQLTGMQLFEPGQLELVAIVMVEDNDFAMAEDTTGKGYILQKGMKIGKRGIITAIQPNEVIIEETAFTRTGKKLTSNTVMLLKKEGEE
jgi:type IV pilus assembly protein PilP